jgi:molybdopterin-binding protein
MAQRDVERGAIMNLTVTKTSADDRSCEIGYGVDASFQARTVMVGAP